MKTNFYTIKTGELYAKKCGHKSAMFKKMFNKIGRLLGLIVALIFLVCLLFQAGLLVAGLYQGDLVDAEKIVKNYSILHKSIIGLLAFWPYVGVALFANIIYKIFKK